MSQYLQSRFFASRHAAGLSPRVLTMSTRNGVVRLSRRRLTAFRVLITPMLPPIPSSWPPSETAIQKDHGISEGNWMAGSNPAMIEERKFANVFMGSYASGGIGAIKFRVAPCAFLHLCSC